MTIFDNISNTYDDWYKTRIGKHVDLVESEWGKLYTSKEFKEFKENIVFQHAQLRNIEDFKKQKSKKIFSIKECLYIPPDIKEEEISMKKEEELSKIEKPGFFCVLWIK